mmetsp:Transcript_33030/g.75395  ORF Transcript_33030/g.75395 Transcript_33030/m.75395 type:complete len:182 (-) Transcript_33030:100-645(-)
MGSSCCTQEEGIPTSATTEQDRYHASLVDMVDATTLAPQSELVVPRESGQEEAVSAQVAAQPVLAPRQEDGGGGEGDPQKSALKDVSAVGEGKLFVTILRVNKEEKLGIDLKHCEGYLLVKHIYEDFAAARHGGTGGGLKVGDKIYAVNLVHTDLNKMVEECKDAVSLRFQISRTKQPEIS